MEVAGLASYLFQYVRSCASNRHHGRTGAGTTLVQWGLNQAENFGLAAYLEIGVYGLSSVLKDGLPLSLVAMVSPLNNQPFGIPLSLPHHLLGNRATGLIYFLEMNYSLSCCCFLAQT